MCSIREYRNSLVIFEKYFCFKELIRAGKSCIIRASLLAPFRKGITCKGKIFGRTEVPFAVPLYEHSVI